MDEIGDYILFRNFIQEIRNAEKYSAENIVLIGNQLWKDLAIAMDAELVDRFIWVDRNRISERGYLFSLLNDISKLSARLVVNGSTTRKPISDILCFNIFSPVKYCAGRNEVPVRNIQKIRDWVYNRMVHFPADLLHEFKKNRFLWEQVLDAKITIERPVISNTLKCFGQGFKMEHNEYIIVFIGATDALRKWPAQKFIQLLLELLARHSYQIMIVGGKAEMDVAATIANNINNSRIINMTGKTDLVSLLSMVRSSLYVVGNESGLLHIAAALAKPTICILGGGHFGRFVPYDQPELITSAFVKMDCYSCNWNCIYSHEGLKTYPCIEKISVQQVLNSIDNTLKMKVA